MSKINWDTVRDEYVTGDESFAGIAKRLGVSSRAVERHASASENGRKTWGEMRETHRAEVSAKCTRELVAAQAEAAAATQQRHVEMLRWLFDLAKANLEDALKRCSAKDKVKYGLAILAMERRVHGLDRVHVEVSGKDGGPIAHDISLDEETRARAEEFLEHLFGDAADRDQRPPLRVVS